MNIYKYACLIILGYISGSLVWGYWMARIFGGVDIRDYGSGNIGATNVYRVLGPAAGLSTFILDALKGAFPVLVAKKVCFSNPSPVIIISVGLAAILGHNFSIFLRGKGGKGVACSFGVMLAVFPEAALCALIVWLFVFFPTGYVSLGSVAGALSLPFFIYIFQKNTVYTIFGILIFIVIVRSHRQNIKRLMEHKENRVRLWKK